MSERASNSLLYVAFCAIGFGVGVIFVLLCVELRSAEAHQRSKADIALQEGYEAAKNELPYQLCPYSPTDYWGGQWRKGYAKWLLEAKNNPFLTDDSEFYYFDE